VNTLNHKLPQTERRKLVTLGLQAGKSNRAIAKELNVDEGTVRRDKKFLETPEYFRPVKKERSKNLKKVKPAYDPDDTASLELHFQHISKALRLWIAEENMVLNEIEYVLHEAGKRLYLGRDLVSGIPEPTESPSKLMIVTRPDGSVWGEFLPNPDFWADWLARWLARCLPRQHELHQRLLKETSLWARS
jgi:hypothetical protein